MMALIARICLAPELFLRTDNHLRCSAVILYLASCANMRVDSWQRPDIIAILAPYKNSEILPGIWMIEIDESGLSPAPQGGMLARYDTADGRVLAFMRSGFGRRQMLLSLGGENKQEEKARTLMDISLGAAKSWYTLLGRRWYDCFRSLIEVEERSLKIARLIAILLCLSFTACFSQHPSTSPHAANSTASLAKPVSWGIGKYRLFKNDEANVSATLATSWIPGEGHKGMFRYRLSIFATQPSLENQQKHPEWTDPDWKEQFMSRVYACSFYLELYDVDEFRLRTIPLILQKGVDDQARLWSLSVNSSVQMDADEYRSLVGTDKTSGSWSLSWSCPSNP
jgi:hypothetical protein